MCPALLWFAVVVAVATSTVAVTKRDNILLLFLWYLPMLIGATGSEPIQEESSPHKPLAAVMAIDMLEIDDDSSAPSSEFKIPGRIFLPSTTQVHSPSPPAVCPTRCSFRRSKKPGTGLENRRRPGEGGTGFLGKAR